MSRFRCPICDSILHANEYYRGTIVECHLCGHSLKIPWNSSPKPIVFVPARRNYRKHMIYGACIASAIYCSVFWFSMRHFIRRPLPAPHPQAVSKPAKSLDREAIFRLGNSSSSLPAEINWRIRAIQAAVNRSVADCLGPREPEWPDDPSRKELRVRMAGNHWLADGNLVDPQTGRREPIQATVTVDSHDLLELVINGKPILHDGLTVR